MKAFKRLSAAKKAAGGMPIVRIGFGRNAVHLVAPHRDLLMLKLTEVSLIAPNGIVAGHVILGHLDRLGNANHATPGSGWKLDATCFTKEGGPG